MLRAVRFVIKSMLGDWRIAFDGGASVKFTSPEFDFRYFLRKRFDAIDQHMNYALADL
jgi:hypothetical protein